MAVGVTIIPVVTGSSQRSIRVGVRFSSSAPRHATGAVIVGAFAGQIFDSLNFVSKYRIGILSLAILLTKYLNGLHFLFLNVRHVGVSAI